MYKTYKTYIKKTFKLNSDKMARIECPRCGKINDGTTDFCIYCGTIFEEYNPEDEDFNIFTISKRSNYRGGNLESMPENLSSGEGNYRWMIIIGYLFVILGSILGFIFPSSSPSEDTILSATPFLSFPYSFIIFAIRLPSRFCSCRKKSVFPQA